MWYNFEKMSISIRPIAEADLPLLDQNIRAAYGRPHAVELQDQLRGLLTFYVVWLNEQPIGTGFVRWDGPRDSDVRAAYPNCPEIYRLGIAEEHRSQGIGTQLISVCERAAAQKGFRQIGLGVALENPRADILYRRLGYTQSSVERYMDVYQYQTADGTVKTAQDPLRFLIKPIARK